MGSIRIEVRTFAFTPLSSRADCRASELIIGCQHSHLVAFHAVEPLAGALKSPEDVAAADDDAYLNSRSDDGFDLLRIAVEHVGRKTVFLSPLQGFTAEFQEYSVVFHKRSGI